MSTLNRFSLTARHRTRRPARTSSPPCMGPPDIPLPPAEIHPTPHPHARRVNGAPIGHLRTDGHDAGLAAVSPLTGSQPGPKPGKTRSHGVGGFYLAAVMGTLISADTSWRFFGEVVRITALRERVAMFAVLEVALVACGYAMRANVRRTDGTPGSARVLAWVLCGFSAYMAVVLSGPVAGIARVALGPVLALVC